MELRKIATISLTGQLISGLNFMAYVNRAHQSWNIDSFTYIASTKLLLSNYGMMNIQIMPVMAMFMTIIPKNIEASMFSVVNASLMLGLLWGGQLTATIIYQALGITSDDLS